MITRITKIPLAFFAAVLACGPAPTEKQGEHHPEVTRKPTLLASVEGFFDSETGQMQIADTLAPNGLSSGIGAYVKTTSSNSSGSPGSFTFDLSIRNRSGANSIDWVYANFTLLTGGASLLNGDGYATAPYSTVSPQTYGGRVFGLIGPGATITRSVSFSVSGSFKFTAQIWGELNIVDCVVTAWSGWSGCSTTCGGGIQSQTRSILTLPANGGAACPVLEEQQACNVDPCVTASCQPGEFVSVTTPKTCAPCTTGYSTTVDAIACTPFTSCPLGEEATGGATPTEDRICTPCAVGQFCSGGAASAVDCGTGVPDHDSDPTTPCCNPGLISTAPPTLGPAPHLGVTTTRSILFRGAPVDPAVAVVVSGNSTNVFDASAFVDPNSCDPGTLRFQWRVTFVQVDGSEMSPYTDQGITGYITPVLTIKPNAMPAGTAYVDLKVSSAVDPSQFTEVRIHFTIDATSRLLISYYLQCKATGTLCERTTPGCLCFIPAALPTSEPMS